MLQVLSIAIAADVEGATLDSHSDTHPVTTPTRSIRDAHAAQLGNELVGQAIADGRRSGALSAAEANRLEQELLESPPRPRRSIRAGRQEP
jgi:hypothetical protein